MRNHVVKPRRKGASPKLVGDPANQYDPLNIIRTGTQFHAEYHVVSGRSPKANGPPVRQNRSPN